MCIYCQLYSCHFSGIRAIKVQTRDIDPLFLFSELDWDLMWPDSVDCCSGPVSWCSPNHMVVAAPCVSSNAEVTYVITYVAPLQALFSPTSLHEVPFILSTEVTVTNSTASGVCGLIGWRLRYRLWEHWHAVEFRRLLRHLSTSRTHMLLPQLCGLGQDQGSGPLRHRGVISLH